MAVQLSVAVRNARLDVLETTISTAPILKIRSGSIPANCAAADSGTVLVTMTLPSDWMANASGGAKAMSGTWAELAADNSGTAGFFRIYDSGGTTCHFQGTTTVTGGGGDMTLDSVTITAGSPVTVTGFTLTDGNA